MEDITLELNTSICGLGDEVEKVSYSNETVWIDNPKLKVLRCVSEMFGTSVLAVIKFAKKWLKDRQAKTGKNPVSGHGLSVEDIEHYQKIVMSAISETIRIMAEIDKVIEAHGGWPDAFIVDS